MTENLKISIKTPQRSVDWIMTFDMNFMPDRNMRLVIERDGACEPEVVHLMTRVLREGDIAVDGGANVGFFTCLMSRLVGDTGLVYAVEPTPINQKKIEHNLANNKMANVKLVKAALGQEVGMTVLHMASDTGSNSIMPHADGIGSMAVTLTTLDHMPIGGEPRLIKLDIEGAEELALRGAVSLVVGPQHPYVACELNAEALARFGSTRFGLRHLADSYGYGTWLLHTDGSLPRFVPPGTEIKSEKQNLMVLFATPSMVAEAWQEVEP